MELDSLMNNSKPLSTDTSKLTNKHVNCFLGLSFTISSWLLRGDFQGNQFIVEIFHGRDKEDRNKIKNNVVHIVTFYYLSKNN